LTNILNKVFKQLFIRYLMDSNPSIDVETGIENCREDLFNECETPKTNDSDDINTVNENSEEEVVSNITENIKTFWEAYSESEDESDFEIDSDDEKKTKKRNSTVNLTKQKTKRRFSKLTFEQIKNKMNNNFDMSLIYNYSSALDILSSYVKCHHHIYTEASYHCSFTLNILMMPCILLTTVCGVASAFQNEKISLYIAIINGFISFLLSIVNFFKLDAKAEAHKISAYQYSKLKNYVEFTSGEIYLFQNPIIKNKDYIEKEMKLWKQVNKHMILDTVKYKECKYQKLESLYKEKRSAEEKLISLIQNKIITFKKNLKNIQENNNFILPKFITRNYNHVYNINVFTYIKNIESYRLYILNELRNVKNELRFNNHHNDSIEETILEENVKRLYKRKNELMREFFELNNGYALIDSMFHQEIKNVYLKKKYRFSFLLQKIINGILVCCCVGHFDEYDSVTQCFIPNRYKNPLHFGYQDQNGVYLLQKIMEYNRN
jgi:hypothetical protein